MNLNIFRSPGQSLKNLESYNKTSKGYKFRKLQKKLKKVTGQKVTRKHQKVTSFESYKKKSKKLQGKKLQKNNKKVTRKNQSLVVKAKW